MVLKADFEAKSEEVKTFRLAVKDKFEMERKLKEIQDKYEALQKTYKGFEEEAKKTKENIELIGQLREENEKLTFEVENVSGRRGLGKGNFAVIRTSLN